MADNLSVVWNKFFQHRTRTLWERFPGYYRALVVETNDPLDMYRVRFKCPDLHDFDLKPEDCPWAVAAFDLGGKRTGRFSHPCIGDWVWITFERQHPYGPSWVGFATPTRRKFYTYPQVFQITPLSVNEKGRPAEKPDDYDEEYLPKDGRPMMHGWQDRYGNLDIHSSVGFFPSEHQDPPPPPDHDAVQGSQFDQKRQSHQVNNPDKKYMARVTKYGVMLVLSDQGYHWKKDGDVGEFDGDFEQDESFETNRWKTLQKILNEDHPKTSEGRNDARRFLGMTRYGSRIEMRDTGWAQQGPIQSRSRPGEFGPRQVLSQESDTDYRWIKLRTKGGMLWQAYDKGFHPDEDVFVKRPILEELGPKSEEEDKHWKDKDGRWIRTVTRYGLKIVLDDRGTDDKQAHTKEHPRCNGILIKGRRTPAVKKVPKKGDPRGFFWEFNENDEANHTVWGTPMGQVVEMNDRYQYMILTVALGKNWAAKWRGLEENEFIRKPAMLKNPEKTSYHLKLDHDNEYLRLKTRGGKGPRPMMPVNESEAEFHQGLEARDGKNGDGPWTEVVDSEHRGIWWSKRERLGIWRAKKGKKLYVWMDERKKKVVIYNNESNGNIEIYAQGKVNIISKKDVTVSSDKNVNIRAANVIKMQAGGTKLTLNSSGVHTNKNYYGRRLFATICRHQVVVKCGKKKCKGHTTTGCKRPGGARVGKPDNPEVPDKIEPEDRAKTYNEPFEECPKEEVEHPVS
jgi:hypothetical protein